MGVGNRSIRTRGVLGVEKKWCSYYYPATGPSGVVVVPVRENTDLSVISIRQDPLTELGAPSQTVGNLFQIPQGDFPWQREGNRVVIRSIEILGALSWYPDQMSEVADVEYEDPIVHFMVVLDTQSNGEAPLFSDLFEDPTQVQASLASFENDNFGNMLMRNKTNTNRFKTLVHKKFHRPTANNGAVTDVASFWSSTSVPAIPQMSCMQRFKIFKKVSIPVTYGYAATADISNIRDNSLHVFCWHSGMDANGSAAHLVGLSYTARCNFYG